MYLNQGNVGINTAMPGKKLEVVGDVRITGPTTTLSGTLYFAGSTPTDKWHVNYNTDRLSFVQTGIAEYVVFKDGGNVGIGTTTPAEKVSIAGGNLLLDNGQIIKFKELAR